ncbi:tRNA glutamyl-Q(34) synthetase GluQRS [Nakamurella aerolata]|uniref:Glutamyl-Q tRNA(Asp) synthetase n=1 Tax=Nakamurella aerolata TaxID=1656892 RepID=A0A849A3Y5_9ACTN|nr:tRNA glutamyl-Q(34) synthetase GluQRS [Nakamurella aerolata]NNG34777.1 tRNA glutamyl-Q(34) synthetase GluQRS [Nakamurella aerolata]
MPQRSAPERRAGRYAPSPSGDLHLGNLRTALLAWLFARSERRPFGMRIEDLDERSRPGAADRQLADLAALGIDWDGEPLVQSEHREVYAAVIDRLSAHGRTFECFCSRKDILAAPTAPHAPPGAYPGTCRDLTDAERARRRAEADRPPAIRLRSDATEFTVHDRLHGDYTGTVDDFVLARFDGTPAYNLVSVIDDNAQRVGQVVRGDDLLPSTPRQAYLATLLHLPVPEYAHVPLVLGPTGQRLAKRDGAVTLEQLAAKGTDAGAVLNALAVSLGLAAPGERVDTQALLRRFDPDTLPTEPWTAPAALTGAG